MKVTKCGNFYLGRLEDISLSEKEKQKLIKFGNEEAEEEILDMIAEAEQIADPKALFTVTGTEKEEQLAKVNGVLIRSEFASEKLSDKKRCFPYIVSCSSELDAWSMGYKGDPLSEYWADEIKQVYLQKMMTEFFGYVKEKYRTGGHFTVLNPGFLADWPVAGQKELFDILGGTGSVKENAGVYYTDSYLMIPNKTVSGIGFESEVFFENCQYCPIEGCPNRRSKRVE